MHTIPWEQPKRVAEANIVAELYHQCKIAGVKCYLAYKLGHCRFDAVIISHDRIIAIIEAKSWRRPHSIKEVVATKQYEKYSRLGPLLLYVTSFEDVVRRVREIKELIRDEAQMAGRQ